MNYELAKKLKDAGYKFDLVQMSGAAKAIDIDGTVFAMPTLEEQRMKIMWDIEKKFGGMGTMNGSLGYQGLEMGITAYQTPEDKQRDEVLQIIQNMK